MTDLHLFGAQTFGNFEIFRKFIIDHICSFGQPNLDPAPLSFVDFEIAKTDIRYINDNEPVVD